MNIRRLTYLLTLHTVLQFQVDSADGFQFHREEASANFEGKVA